MACPEDDLVRSVVKLWREIVQPRPTAAECWTLDRALRDKFGGKDYYVKKRCSAERQKPTG